MKKHLNYSKGITLVALVITIIILFMLAGVALQAFTGSGIFGQAIKAKEQAKLAELEEHLKLTLTEMIAYKNGEKVTIDEYIKYLKEIEKINITDEYEENGKYIIEVDDKYVFEISDKDTYISIDKEGLKEDLAPKIVLESITNTTNSISVQVSTKRNEGGKIEYYIKAEDEEEYTLKETTKDTNYTYTGLTQNKKYNVKIVAVTKNKLTAEILVDRTLESVPDLIEGDVTFTYSVDGQEIDEITWTNKAVTVTASTTIKGYRLQTSKDGKNWSNEASQTYTENGYIYAVLYDGTNYGSSTSGHILNIDTQKPVANISSTTTNSITFTGTDTAKTGESSSGIAAYIVQESSTPPSADSTSWQSYNGTSKTVSGLTQGKTYYVFVKDNAGNVSAAASKGTGTVTNLTSANITFTYSPSSWTNGSVKVTAALKDMTSSYTLKITDSNPVGASKQTALGWANAGTGITVSSNKAVYAVLIDNEGQIGAAAAGNVDKIDKTKPRNITIATGTVTTSSIEVTVGAEDIAGTNEKASGIKEYRFSSDNGNTWSNYQTSANYTFKDLIKGFGATYNIKVEVKDNAGNSAIESKNLSTSLDSGYIIENAGTELIRYNWDQSGTGTYRILTKTNSGKAIAGICYIDGAVAPVVVSTDVNAVSYCTTDSGDRVFTSTGSIEWGGTKYYYSSDGYWFASAIPFSSKLKNINQKGEDFDSIATAAGELLTKYYTNNSSGYEVNYNINSELENITTKTYFNTGSSVTLITDRPSGNGYHLLGWSTSYNATSATYYPGGTYTFDQSTTLYAIWEKHDFSDETGICTKCGSDERLAGNLNLNSNWNLSSILSDETGFDRNGGNLYVSYTANKVDHSLGGNVVMLVYNKQIDLTNIDKIVMNSELYSNHPNATNYTNLGICSSNSATSYNDFYSFEKSTEVINYGNVHNNYNLVLDVSNYTGNYYLKITTRHELLDDIAFTSGNVIKNVYLKYK